MWIEDIFIENFGALGNFAIKGLGPKLNLIIGPNEAGKTTLMEFLHSILFGFRKKNSATNTYEPSNGNLRSGRVHVQTDEGRLQILRIEKRGRKEGIVTVLDEKGTPVEQSLFPIFGHGSQRKLYESLFAFDLDRVRDLDHEALPGKIVAAALGSMRVNPLEILKKLEDKSARWTKRSYIDKESLIAIQSNVNEIEKKLKALRDKPARYYELTRELEQVTARRKLLSDSISQAEAEAFKLERLTRHKVKWVRLVSVELEVEGLNRCSRFPIDGISRLEQAQERLSQSEAELVELRDSFRRSSNRLPELNPDNCILEHSAKIYDLSREAAALSALPAEIEQRSAACARSKRMLGTEIEALGKGWNDERISASDPSLRLEQEISVFLDSFEENKNRIKDLQVRLSDSDERARILDDQIAGRRAEIEALAPLCRGFLTPESVVRLQEWKNNLDRIHDLEQRLSESNLQIRHLVDRKISLDQEAAAMRNRNNAFFAAPIFWGIICILFVAMGLIAGHISNNSYFGILILLIGALISLPAAIATLMLKKHRSVRILGLKNDSDTLTTDIMETEKRRRSDYEQIRQMRQRSVTIVKDVLGNHSAGLKDVIDAEIRSAAACEPHKKRQALQAGLSADLEDLRFESNRSKRISDLLAQETKAFEDRRSQWSGWISGRGLDHDLEPDIAVNFVRKLRDVKHYIQNLREEERLLQTAKQKWDRFASRVCELATIVDETAQDDPLNLVEKWVIKERKDRELLAERMSLLEKTSDLEIRINAATARSEESRNKISALYEAAGTDTEEAYREKSRMHDLFMKLSQEREILLSQLLDDSNFPDIDVMRDSLSSQDWDANRERLNFLRERIPEMRDESEELATRSGSLKREIESFENEDECDRLILKKNELRTIMDARVRELIEVEIAAYLLERTLKLYERERQPIVLEKTSAIFGRITGNEFKRVIFPLDGGSIKIQRQNDDILDEELLSRGTLEQLYLSFRLAHLDVYHRGKTSIPLVMDDVLVNFDPERAERTASALADFCDESGIQIVFFTCHPHTADAFPERCLRFELKPSA